MAEKSMSLTDAQKEALEEDKKQAKSRGDWCARYCPYCGSGAMFIPIPGTRCYEAIPEARPNAIVKRMLGDDPPIKCMGCDRRYTLRLLAVEY